MSVSLIGMEMSCLWIFLHSIVFDTGRMFDVIAWRFAVYYVVLLSMLPAASHLSLNSNSGK